MVDDVDLAQLVDRRDGGYSSFARVEEEGEEPLIALCMTARLTL